MRFKITSLEILVVIVFTSVIIIQSLLINNFAKNNFITKHQEFSIRKITIEDCNKKLITFTGRLQIIDIDVSQINKELNAKTGIMVLKDYSTKKTLFEGRYIDRSIVILNSYNEAAVSNGGWLLLFLYMMLFMLIMLLIGKIVTDTIDDRLVDYVFPYLSMGSIIPFLLLWGPVIINKPPGDRVRQITVFSKENTPIYSFVGKFFVQEKNSYSKKKVISIINDNGKIDIVSAHYKIKNVKKHYIFVNIIFYSLSFAPMLLTLYNIRKKHRRK
jgi:hypothetical protein